MVTKKKIKLGKSFILDIYTSIKSGKNPSTISKKLNLSLPRISYYLRRLERDGYIKKIGYGTWKANQIEVKNIKLGSKEVKKVRGHAFVWKIRIPKTINWKKLLKNKGIDYSIVNKLTPRIIIKGKKVWLGKKNVIIYDLESYFGSNSIESKKYAIDRLLEVIRALEYKIGISLKKDELYTFTVARNHYSLIKNCLAIQCNKEGRKLQVSNDKGMWFIIDNSYNLDEAETISPVTALPDNLGIQKYFNEHKETGFEVTPKFTLNALNQLTTAIAQSQIQLQEYRKENINHLKLINEYRKENVRWRIAKEKIIKKELKEQKVLSEF